MVAMKRRLRFLIIPVGLLCLLTWFANVLNHSWDGLVILGSTTIVCFWLYVWITWFF